MSYKKPSKAIPTALIPGINRIKPNHDREMLKARHIKSPDLSGCIRHYDPSTKATTFFETQKRYLLFLHRQEYPEKFVENVKKGGRANKN